MRTLQFKNSFKKDLKKVVKRRLPVALLTAVVTQLREDLPLAPARRDHNLQGDWQGWRECHIQPDWLLIYRREGDDELWLARTGTHSDLFD